MANDSFAAAQARPAGGVLTTLVITSAGGQKILGCLKCCNVGTSPESILLYYGPGVTPGKLIQPAFSLAGLSTFTIKEAWPMYGFADSFSVQSQNGNVVFTAFTDLTSGKPFTTESFLTRQSQPAAGALAILFQCPLAPTALGAIAATLKVTNTSSAPDNFTIEFDSGGSGSSISKSVHYQQPIAGNTTITFAEGWLMAPNDIIWVSSGGGNCVFTVHLDQVS